MSHVRTSPTLPLHLCCLGLLAAGPAMAQDPAPVPDVSQSSDAVELDRIVVTAMKREKSIHEIAGSVSAQTGEQLQELGAQSLSDYIQRTPGVSFNSYQPGVSHVVIRGIATSSGNVQGQPTTGYFLNDVPLNEPGWTIAIPDIDTFDLNRVEVLRGPQGTLFGAGSMGGAINYIANLADAAGFDAAVEATLSQTRNADLGYGLKAMVNVPVKEDVLAVRAVAQYRQAPGYIDNLGTGKRGANDLNLSGGRFSAVLTPADGTTVSWLSLVQDLDLDDNAYVMPGLGDLERATAIPEFTRTKVSVHNLRLDQDFSWGSLTAMASYQKKSQDWRFDATPWRAAYNADLGLDLDQPLYVNTGGESTGKSVELRLASALGSRVEWLIGGMYFDTDKPLYEQLASPGAAGAFDRSPLFGPGSGAVIAPDGDVFNGFYGQVDGSEKALFGEATVHLAPDWKLTAGGRLFRTQVSTRNTAAGFQTYPGAPDVTDAVTRESGFNPKVSLSWDASERLMLYALASEGFRFGTPNITALTTYPIPAASGSDSLYNYELGARAHSADGRLQLDATLFYVDWKDIQLRMQTPDNINYAGNGGKAHSRGVELATAWRPLPQFEWLGSVTWQQARLDDPMYILWYGDAPAGSRLPGSSDWSVSNVLNYRFDGAWAPMLTLSHQYLSGGYSDLESAVPGSVPNEQGNYNLFDLRLRVSLGNTDLSLFGSNLTDKRGVTRTVVEANGLGQGIVRPRTFGMTVHWRY